VDNGGYSGEGNESDGREYKPKSESRQQTQDVLDTEDEHFISKLYKQNEKYINWAVMILAAGGYHAYFIYCIIRHYQYDIPVWSCGQEDFCPNQDPDQPFWCQSLAFLIIITAFTWAGVIYGYVLKPMLGTWLTKATEPLFKTADTMLQKRIVRLMIYAVVIGGILTYLIINAIDDTRRLISIAGYFVLIGIGWIFSTNPRRVRWRQVVWGLTIQFGFGLIVIKWKFGQDLVSCLSSKVKTFLGFSDYGSSMIYGYLVTDTVTHTAMPFTPGAYTGPEQEQVPAILEAINQSGAFGGGGGSGMMFQILSLIYFLSFFVSMLYYLGVLQFIVAKLGWLLSVTVGTTAAESMNAAANIFLGQTEAPLLIRPFLSLMTKSEIHAVMTGGFATIAGTVLGMYIGMGIEATALITASVMAAPTALAVSKLFYPETEESRTKVGDIKVDKGDDANVLDAAAKGASTAIMLVLNIAASLIAFKSFVAFLDAAIGWFGGFAGDSSLSFQDLLGYLFWPLAWIMGVRAEDCSVVAKLIGMKLLVTELPAFQDLADIKAACVPLADGTVSDACTLDSRSIVIATYALCGFANFASMGMQIGGLSGLAPDRKSDFAQVVLRAMIAGCWVSFLNACIAGALT